MTTKKICIISGEPSFLGGVAIYTKRLIEAIKQKNSCTKIFWVYADPHHKEGEIYDKEGITYIILKASKIPLIGELSFNVNIFKFLQKNNFHIINSHGFNGLWLKFYKKKRGQKIIHTFHGSTYYFYKTHLKRFGIIKKILYLPTLLVSYYIEKYPWERRTKLSVSQNM